MGRVCLDSSLFLGFSTLFAVFFQVGVGASEEGDKEGLRLFFFLTDG